MALRALLGGDLLELSTKTAPWLQPGTWSSVFGASILASPHMPSLITTAARRGLAVSCCLALLAPGCKKPGAVASELTQAPTMETATGEAKCGVRSSTAKPLVVEWPAAERAALEARSSRGLVAVRYQGCEMEVLTTCTVGGAYEYVGLTQKREGVKISNADELYAQLPVGAAGLEAKLERSGQLNVDMVIVGRREADKNVFNERDLEGRCDNATHVITGLTVGAFSFYSGAAADVAAGAKAHNVGVGAASSSEQEVLKSDGDGQACVAASTSDEVPPEGCAALLRVEVVPIDRIFSSPATSTASNGSSGTTDSGPDRVVDPEYEKKLRNAKLLTYGGYIGALGGLTAMGLGARMYSSNRDALQAEVGNDEVSADRQSNISSAQTGLIVTYVGAGLSVAGLAMAIFGGIRTKNLKAKHAMAVSPTMAPGMAGLSLRGRF